MSNFYNVFSPIRSPKTNEVLSGGWFYIGIPYKDPTIVKNQLSLTATNARGQRTTLGQPVRLGPGGLPERDSQPVQIDFTERRYSIVIFNCHGELEYSSAFVRLTITHSDTEAVLAQFNEYGLPEFIHASENNDVPISYEIGTRVRYNGGTYQAIRDDVISLPTNQRDWIPSDVQSLYNELETRLLGVGRIVWFGRNTGIPERFLHLNGELYRNEDYPALINSGCRFVDVNPVDKDGMFIEDMFRLTDMQDYLRPNNEAFSEMIGWQIPDHRHIASTIRVTGAPEGAGNRLIGNDGSRGTVLNVTGGVHETELGGDLHPPHINAFCTVYAGQLLTNRLV